MADYCINWPFCSDSVHWHPEFLGAHPYPHCVLIFRVFLRTPAPILPHKKISKNGQESKFHINSPYVLWFWQIRQFMITDFLNIHIKFTEIIKKSMILSVSESGSAPEIRGLSVGRTDTVSVRYAHWHCVSISVPYVLMIS
jgi:hypothetical protein